MEPARTVRFFDVPPSLSADAAAARAEAGPVAPRPAATVMVVRDTPHGPEVFMLRRRSSMAFAPNMMVFPGGGVDPRDADDDLPWHGPSPERWARWLGADDEGQARELVVAAAREVFEECGVLLAGPDGDTLVGDVSGPEWEAERDGLLSRQQSFSELLIRRGLVLRSDLMRAWAHWVTPEFESRRYDTRFFATRLPEGQTPDDRTSEADVADWMRPADLLADVEAGRAAMLPPTVVCVERVAAAADADEFLASAPPMARVMPTLDTGDDGVTRLRVELPVPSGESQEDS